MAQFTQSLCLNLADAFPGHMKLPSYLLQCFRLSVIQAKPLAQHLLFPLCQRRERLHELFMQQCKRGLVCRNCHMLILDEIPKMAVLFLSDRGLQRYRILGNLADFPHPLHRNIHFLRNFFRRWFSSKLLHKLSGGTNQTIDGLYHVHRNANGTCLICDGPGNSLTNPPGSISGKLITLAIIKLLHSLDQPQIAFLDQIEKLHATAHIFFRNADHQTEICLRQALFCLLVAQLHALCQLNFLVRGKQRNLADFLQVHTDRIFHTHTFRYGKIQLLKLCFFLFLGIFIQKQFWVDVIFLFRAKHIHMMIVQKVINAVQLFRIQNLSFEEIQNFPVFQHILFLFSLFQKQFQFLIKSLCTFFHINPPFLNCRLPEGLDSPGSISSQWISEAFSVLPAAL